MSEEPDQNIEPLLLSFRETLGQNKYKLRSTLILLNKRLTRKRETAWRLVVADFPIEINGRATRVDLVFRHAGWASQLYLLANCVVPDPSLSNWCFLRAPSTVSNRSERMIVEYAVLRDDDQVRPHAGCSYTGRDVYHYALEVGSNDSEDTKARGRSLVMERAAAKLSIGVGGMIKLFTANKHFLSETDAYSRQKNSAGFLPVIFTASDLWSSDADLAASNEEIDHADFSGVNLKKETWVLYQHHISPLVKYAPTSSEQPRNLEELLEREYIRTVAVVSPSGLVDFLRWAANYTAY